jgi:hypothetical protein
MAELLERKRAPDHVVFNSKGWPTRTLDCDVDAIIATLNWLENNCAGLILWELLQKWGSSSTAWLLLYFEDSQDSVFWDLNRP